VPKFPTIGFKGRAMPAFSPRAIKFAEYCFELGGKKLKDEASLAISPATSGGTVTAKVLSTSMRTVYVLSKRNGWTEE
jgi:hypothetical protein